MPGLTVGSTLDGGPNWADDARFFLVACEVDGGAVVALVDGAATASGGITSPVLVPADVLDVPAGVAGFDDGNQRSATTRRDPYQAVL